MEPLHERYAQMVAAGRLDRDPVQQEVLPELDRIRAALQQPPPRGLLRRAPEPIPGLYLWGGVGCGKSMLMDMFVDTLTVPARRVHFHAFMQEIHAGLHEARQQAVSDALIPVAQRLIDRVRCLAFDEMQITDITDAMIVGRLFQVLFDGGVVVVTTSNRPPEDLYKDGLNRQLFLPFIDLVKDRMVVHEMAGRTDYRQRKLAGNPAWFTPVDAAARGRIAEIWHGLTDGQGGAPLTLDVHKREVTIPAFRNGVARARFHALCGQPLGAADYLALARAARVLVLEDIPQMGRSNFNEARRFVTLIDALYEAGVRLVCSAAAAPEYLYVEGEGSFEFKRTASRLREMQSESWYRC